MKRILIILTFLCGGFLSTTAQNLSEAQIKQQINTAAASLATMQCDFIQTKHLKMLKSNMVAKGKMYYQKSDKLRWEYITPYNYTFILNGNKVLIKNKNRNDLIDVRQNKIFKEIARIMMNSVVGNCLSDEKSFKTNIASTNTEYVATLQPLRKDMKQMFKNIILHFNKQKSMVSTVELIEKNGDKTIIELNNVRVNETISSSMFSVR